MQSTGEILKNKKTTYVPYDHMGKQSLQHMEHMTYVYNEYDEAVDNFKHLRAGESFRKLHIYHARRLGVDKFVQLAKTAEQEGKNPARYFSWLLKNEM